MPKLAVPEEDFEADFDLSGELTQLSLRPLSHQGSKSSLEWGDKDQTSSSQSSDAYSTLGFDRHSLSSNSTQPESGTEDDDEEDLDGLVIPSSIFDSGKAAKHLARVLVEGTVVVEDVDESEVMPCTDSVIVGVVRGGDLHGTGTELHVDGFRVGDDGHLAAGDEGVDGELAVQVLVARVVRVDGDGSVSEHGFRTGGGNDDLLVWEAE